MPASSISFLDNIRISNGAQALLNYYRDILRCDRQKALGLINEPALQFCTLYILKAEVPGRETGDFLDPAYARALMLAEELSGKTSRQAEKEMRTAGGDISSVLEWMFRTGIDEDSLNSGYELLMDRIACLLAKSFRNRAILPELADLIFLRHRRGALIHDLTWAFFETCCLDSLAFIAYRFDSSDAHDVSLAGKLLGFIPGTEDRPAGGRDNRSVSGSGSGAGTAMTYDRAMYWLSENRPFLYYTGESLQYSSRPQHYRLSQAAKYLCTPVSPDTGEPSAPVRDNGQELLLSRFDGLDEQMKQRLADFSWRLYRRDSRQWRVWIALPLEEQIAGLSYITGGLT